MLERGEDVAEVGEELRPGRRVERAERLVEQQQLGRERERAGQADALRLAAGQGRGRAVGDVLEAESLEPFRARDDGAPARRRA